MESKISRVETLVENTGQSLAGICEAIDGQQTTKSGNEEYHCCVNRDNNKMICATTSIAGAIGIDTTNGENTCDSRNTAPLCVDD